MKSVFRNGLVSKYGIEEVRREEETDDQYNKRLLTSAFFVVKLTQVDSAPVEVIDGLFIGSIGCAYSKESLIASGITDILCVAGSPKLKFPENFRYKRVSLVDDPSECDRRNLVDVAIPECIGFIDNALSGRITGCGALDDTNSSSGSPPSPGRGSKVLVHCYLGVSRCAFISCAYLMYRRRLSVLDALDLIRVARPIAKPNSAFMFALREYEKVLCGEPRNSLASEASRTEDGHGTPSGEVGGISSEIPFYQA